MNNTEIKNILLAENVNYLYHANTVRTSITFLENGGLISRSTVEDLGLVQTSQTSDETDRLFNVDYDIFFDSVDIHERIKKINNYGPVTFVYSINVINILPEGTIKITKKNPMYWNDGMTEEEKYFTTYDEMFVNYRKGNFNQHFTIVNQHTPLSFNYLCKIIIDNPCSIRQSDQEIFEKAVERINEIATTKNITVPIVVRECSPGCNCKNQYNGFKEGYIYHRFGI